MNSQELHPHCQQILNQRRIKNKIVVLCEGQRTENQGRPSPQSYRRMQQMPDANFYNACVPKKWNQYRPQFFNCGDRKDVIDTYFNLIELHSQDINNSYLNPEKLFAIVDLDNHIQNITNNYDYPFSDTEEIFRHLYEKARVNEKNVKEHRIWVTGLIHKEAYFLIPELQSVFDFFLNTPNKKLSLEKIYLQMVDDIIHDANLQNNLAKVFHRISYFNGVDCSGIEELSSSWKSQFQISKDELCKNDLIYGLLMLIKAKYYWNQIQPPLDWSSSPQVFRDQLLLEIGKFYSENSQNSRYHIPFFLEILFQLQQLSTDF